MPTGLLASILAIDIPAQEEIDLGSCRYMQLQVPVVQHYSYMGIIFDASLSSNAHAHAHVGCM